MLKTTEAEVERATREKLGVIHSVAEAETRNIELAKGLSAAELEVHTHTPLPTPPPYPAKPPIQYPCNTLYQQLPYVQRWNVDRSQ